MPSGDADAIRLRSAPAPAPARKPGPCRRRVAPLPVVRTESRVTSASSAATADDITLAPCSARPAMIQWMSWDSAGGGSCRQQRSACR